MAKIGDHAIVLGAGIGGLLATRVLSDFYGHVTVVERDSLPDDWAQRRGVPQGRHVHGLLSSGSDVLGRLFPGLLDELAADGATVLSGDMSKMWLRFSGHDLDRSCTFTKPLTSYLASRPFVEGHIRRRLRQSSNVTVLDGHEVVEITATDRVTGARVANRETVQDRVIDGDLVVDAMGRGGRTPALLDKLGYGRPAEERITVQVAYASQMLRIPAGTTTGKLFLAGTTPQRPTGGALFAYENDTWMVTLAGLAGYEPPDDPAEMLAYAAEFAPPPMLAALQAAEPLGEVCRYRYPASQWRRYDRMRRFPDGLLVFGDAICSFNPVYGQGMSVAALEAIALRDCLLGGAGKLSHRFFRATAKPVGRVWQMAAGADLALPQVEGRRSIPIRLSNFYTERVLTAAESDPVVTEGFFRVMNLLDPPARLLRPKLAYRVATGQRRARPGTRTSTKRTPEAAPSR